MPPSVCGIGTKSLVVVYIMYRVTIMIIIILKSTINEILC